MRAMMWVLLNDVIYALLISMILGFGLNTFCTVLIMMLLNIWAIPLMFVFNAFPWWVYYVVVLVWLMDAGIYEKVNE